jgi:ubiquinone/menaquinone biosynthesis C-methylase UbiE
MRVDNFQRTIEWYNQNADHYAEASIAALSIHDLNQLSGFISELSPEASVLDAGCGSGRDTNYLTEQGYQTTGLDISHGLLAEATKRFPDSTFIEGNLLDLPFANETFDGVWSHASLVHLETENDVRRALAEFSRVMKPGGVLHLLVKAQSGESKTAVVSDSLSGHDRFFQYFTVEEVQQLLNEAGFSVSEIKKYHENENNPKGRPEVEWIVSISRKKHA